MPHRQAPSSSLGQRGTLTILAALSFRAAFGAPVFMKDIELAKTHDWFLETPQVYFRCAGEDKRYLTNVIQAHKVYNFSLYESFQPLTELEPPKCKRCGLYEEDLFTKDDVFDEFELCPLDFSEPPEAKLLWRVPNEMNITFQCKECNTKNTFAGGVIYTNAPAGDSHFVFIFLLSIGCAIAASILVAAIAYCYKEGGFTFHRPVDTDAKFLEMFGQEDEDAFFAGDDDDDLDIEVVENRQSNSTNNKHD